MDAAGFQLLRKQSDAGFSRFTVGRESSRVQATFPSVEWKLNSARGGGWELDLRSTTKGEAGTVKREEASTVRELGRVGCSA